MTRARARQIGAEAFFQDLEAWEADHQQWWTDPDPDTGWHQADIADDLRAQLLSRPSDRDLPSLIEAWEEGWREAYREALATRKGEV